MDVKKLLLAGYLGCGNLGDDAMMLGLVGALDNDPVDFAVLSGSPDTTYNTYKLQSIPRMNMPLVDKAIDACDAVVFPGGSILQDVTSVRSVAYYWRIISKAKKSGKKVLLLGQGIGPLNRFLGKKLAVSALKAADAIVVRDPSSAATIKALGVKRPVKLGADTAFLLNERRSMDNVEGFNVGGMRSIGLAPKAVKGIDVAKLFSDLAQQLFKEGSIPVLIEMDREEDGELIQAIREKHGGKIPDMRKIQTPWHLQERLARMDALISMRLHAGVLAATVGTPSVLLSYDPKVDALAKSLGIGAALPIKHMDAAKVATSFNKFIADRDKHASSVKAKAAELRKLANVSVEVLRTELLSTKDASQL